MSRTKAETPECMLNPIHMTAARFAQRNAMTRTCHNELVKRLFDGDGLIAMKDGKRMHMNIAGSSYLKRDLTPFTLEVFETANLIGIVPIAFYKDPDSPIGAEQLIPYVPAFGSYTITTKSVNGRQQFQFYWGADCWLACDQDMLNSGPQWNTGGVFGKLDKTIIIARSFGTSPTIDGALVSNYATIAVQLGFIEELRSRMLVAERINSNPPVITEYNRQSAVTDDPRLKTAYYGGDGDGCEFAAQATYERNAGQQAELKRQMQVYQQTMGLDARSKFDVIDISTSSDPAHNYNASSDTMPWGSEAYLGAERTLVHQTMPSTRSDFVPIVEQASRIVCGIMGVPHTLFASSGGRERAGVEAGSEALSRTVNKWTAVLGDVATLVYQDTIGIVDLHRELRSRIEKKRKNRDLATTPARLLLTEADLLDAKAKTSVRICFDSSPTTTPERLMDLYEQGLINRNTFGELMLRVNNLSRDQLDLRDVSLEQTSEPAAKKPRLATAKK